MLSSHSRRRTGTFASEQSPVVFRLEKGKRGVILCLSNKCDSLATLELDKLFDRFYCGDKAGGEGGFGIGLSVARGISEAHGGSIKVVALDGETLEFVAQFR